jgi:UDPglucose 6-dehydrogenase
VSKRIAVVGTGYVGLVTGVSLSEIGHIVTCIDINKEKISLMIQGKSPFYEPNLEEMMINNIKNNRLYFTSNHAVGFLDAEVIYIALPQKMKMDQQIYYILNNL